MFHSIILDKIAASTSLVRTITSKVDRDSVLIGSGEVWVMYVVGSFHGGLVLSDSRSDPLPTGGS